MPDTPRLRSHDVARALGFSLRVVQLMTAAGEIPGALRRKRVWRELTATEGETK